MTKDQIQAKIDAYETELTGLRADIVNGPQADQPADLIARRDQLTKEIAELKAMLEEE